MAAGSQPSLRISNGESVHVNDHVYVSPPWPHRDGIPYNIARIMEFLPDEGAARSRGKARELYTRVRLAWYYRPSDLNDRPNADPRLLLAAIFSEVQPVSHLRAKCRVRHKDKIPDLQVWKRKPDHFYFQRVFDPYIRKEFDVLRSADVTNLPPEIREVLQSRYEFVVAERDVIGDLTDSLRLCETCDKWAPSHDSVRCDTCKCYFHMACVNPPLVAKPAKGYGWTCGACSRQHDEQVGNAAGRSTSTGKSRSSRTTAKSRSLVGISSVPDLRDINSEDRYFKMWPFRYFGLYTVAEDTLDPDDLIFPKAATRIGPRFQAVVGLWTPTGSRDSPQPNQTPDGIPERGGEDTVEMLSIISNMTPEQIDGFGAFHRQLWPKPAMQRGVDFLEESARRYSLNHLGITQRLTNTTRPRKWQARDSRFWDKDWTAEEVELFEKGIKQHTPEMRLIKEGLKNRSVYEVVRFYGHWKSERLGEEHRRQRANSNQNGRSQSLKRSRSPGSDDEGSVYGFGGDVPRQVCGACRTKESTVWWKAPRGLPSEVMCDQCGISWRKYGDIRSGRIDESKKANGIEKRENTPQPPVKRPKTSTPRAPSPAPVVRAQHVCCCCKKAGPAGRVVQCAQCGVCVHAATYGVSEEEAAAATWSCELCENQKSLESSLNSDCLLCPRTPNERLHGRQSALANTVLRLSKPTEGRGWVHTLCSVFLPETTFTEASRLRLVEGISSVADARWASECSLCRKEGGAVVSCASGCGAQYHVSCAWTAGYTFGFEIRQSKNPRRDPATIVDFRGEVGVMKALIRCKAHPVAPRHWFEICSLNTNGESALQLYCRTYKQVSVSQSYGLLRKAKRLDTLLRAQGFLPPTSAASGAVGQSSSSTGPKCRDCATQNSPCFWSEDGQTMVDPDVAQVLICNQCKRGRNAAVNVLGKEPASGMLGVLKVLE